MNKELYDCLTFFVNNLVGSKTRTLGNQLKVVTCHKNLLLADCFMGEKIISIIKLWEKKAVVQCPFECLGGRYT